jgi:hypothetical protein
MFPLRQLILCLFQSIPVQKPRQGCVLAQAVICRLLTTEKQVQFQGCSHENFSGGGGTGAYNMEGCPDLGSSSADVLPD